MMKKIEVHAANAGNESGWRGIAVNSSIALVKGVNVSTSLTAQCPVGTGNSLDQ